MATFEKIDARTLIIDGTFRAYSQCPKGPKDWGSITARRPLLGLSNEDKRGLVEVAVFMVRDQGIAAKLKGAELAAFERTSEMVDSDL